MTATEAFEDSVRAVTRQLSRWEIGVDAAIHVCAIVAAIVGAVVLLLFAAGRGGVADFVSVGVYSGGLLAMLGCSAAYNMGQWSRYRLWLRNFDQAAIFLMIAGTYTPFTLLHLGGAWRISLTSVVWSLAAAGILVRFVHGRVFERISIALYLALGWMSVFALAPLIAALDPPVLILLAAGGVLYTIGVVFHLWQRLPFQTVIWHGFVVAAAATHFAAVAVSMAGTPAPL